MNYKPFVRSLLTDKNNILVGLLTQVDLANEWMASMIAVGSCRAMGEFTLEQLGLGLIRPVCISGTQTVTEALALLDKHRISALPVVDENGLLFATFSVSDLAAVWIEEAGVNIALDGSVESILAKFSPGTICLAYNEFVSHFVRHFVASLCPLTATRSERFVELLSRMIMGRVHPFWITDDDGKPCGVVSMTDIFKVVCDFKEPNESVSSARAAV